MNARQQRIQNSIRNRAGRQTLLKILLAFTIILGTGGLLLFLCHQTSLRFINVETVKYGELEETVPASAILIKREVVFKAPAVGRFENKVAEGERVRSGSAVGNYFPTGTTKATSVTAPISGIISFKPDGWEEVMSDYSLDGGDHSIFDFNPATSTMEALNMKRKSRCSK